MLKPEIFEKIVVVDSSPFMDKVSHRLSSSSFWQFFSHKYLMGSNDYLALALSIHSKQCSCQ